MCVAVCPLCANNVFKLFFLLMTKCETIVIFYLFIMYTYLKGLFKQLHYFFMINVFQVKSVIFSHRIHFFFLLWSGVLSPLLLLQMWNSILKEQKDNTSQRCCHFFNTSRAVSIECQYESSVIVCYGVNLVQWLQRSRICI